MDHHTLRLAKRLTLLVALGLFAVFAQARWDLTRWAIGAQIDFLPPLVVYTALRLGLLELTVLVTSTALTYDAVSSNPVGVTLLPLFMIGYVLHQRRDLILSGEIAAQFLFGTAASAAAPALQFALLMFLGGDSDPRPFFSPGLLWVWIGMAFTGGAATPLMFSLLNRLFRNRFDEARPARHPAVTDNREIVRGMR